MPVAGHGGSISRADTTIRGSSLTYGEKDELERFFRKLDPVKRLGEYKFKVNSNNNVIKIIGPGIDQKILNI